MYYPKQTEEQKKMKKRHEYAHTKDSKPTLPCDYCEVRSEAKGKI